MSGVINFLILPQSAVQLGLKIIFLLLKEVSVVAAVE